MNQNYFILDWNNTLSIKNNLKKKKQITKNLEIYLDYYRLIWF